MYGRDVYTIMFTKLVNESYIPKWNLPVPQYFTKCDQWARHYYITILRRSTDTFFKTLYNTIFLRIFVPGLDFFFSSKTKLPNFVLFSVLNTGSGLEIYNTGLRTSGGGTCPPTADAKARR